MGSYYPDVISPGWRPSDVDAKAEMDRAAMLMQANYAPTDVERARQILGVNEHSDAAEIVRAAREALKLNHPDHGGDGKRVREIIAARKLLLSLQKTNEPPCQMCKGVGTINNPSAFGAPQPCASCRGTGKRSL